MGVIIALSFRVSGIVVAVPLLVARPVVADTYELEETEGRFIYPLTMMPRNQQCTKDLRLACGRSSLRKKGIAEYQMSGASQQLLQG